jgi:hypothetical protein
MRRLHADEGDAEAVSQALLMADQLDRDHQKLLGAYGDCDGKDWIEEVEAFYVKKPAGYRKKLTMADWITKEVRDHAILHIALMLSKLPGRRKARRFTLRSFFWSPREQKAQTRRFYYEKYSRKGGRLEVVKRDKKTGRFARRSKRERAQIQRLRGGEKHGT